MTVQLHENFEDLLELEDNRRSR